jgi:adenylylsulfate kinase
LDILTELNPFFGVFMTLSVSELECSKILVFLTGLSGSGKSTIATKLSTTLANSFIIDGDTVRQKHSHIPPGNRGLEEMTDLLIGLATEHFRIKDCIITAFVAPRADLRERVKLSMESQGIRFIEVYVSADINTCRRRDPKGLYKRYDDGESISLAGLNVDYNAPKNPDVICQTENQSVETSVSQIIARLRI